MERRLSSLAVIAATVALVLPVAGFAYLSPEQVFDGQTVDLAQAPPTQREAPDVVVQRQQQTAERREEAQNALPSLNDEPVDTYVSTPAKPVNLLDENVQYQLRMEKLKEQQKNAPTIVVAGDGTVVDSNGKVLHSGAPLVSSTGPETALAFLAILLAAVATFIVVGVRSRRLARIAF